MLKRLTPSEIESVRKELDLWTYVERVMPIVKDVKDRGLEALKEYVKKFDNYEGCLELSQEDLGHKSDPLLVKKFEKVLDHLEEFNKTFLPKGSYVRKNGVEGWEVWEPIELLGAYVPGGLYPYPSTVLMTAGLAKRLGVKEVVVATPPRALENEAVVAALYASGVDKVIAAGGAHGIAALAFLAKVHKIVGPGGPYVQAAKVLVSAYVPIDMIAGPTELAVIADGNADPEEIAYDMLAQAEHGPMSFAILFTDSEDLATQVDAIVSDKENNIQGDLYYVVVDDLKEAVNLVSKLAPEHVSVYAETFDIPIAGALSLWSPSPFIDYGAGPNHVLPTGGWAKARGPLSPIDFYRWSTSAKAYEESKELLRIAIEIAKMEGMRYHLKALELLAKKWGI
ncbi:histidinol dehydrogenase [Ignicoccus pacificus DSM 13166]|uniref:Histidinol dehydrogenase n=1 Tax=Ignicoccus pacificus DSM 13166 TaxID=940294 RepID=A0A977K9M3_9CREN|nr:histidinol dehydrogenase [Ignicoccus pacificus DSM 13166]